MPSFLVIMLICGSTFDLVSTYTLLQWLYTYSANIHFLIIKNSFLISTTLLISCFNADNCISGETASLTEQIRSGGLRPALELGVTPSHVSLAADSQGEEEEEEGEGPDSEDGEGPVDDYGYRGDWVYCISLESVGLGGNQITNSGAVALADGLKSNTSMSPQL